MQSYEQYMEERREQWAYEQECERRDREELPDRLRDVVQELALTPIASSLDRWNVISNTLLEAAKEIEDLRASQINK